MDAEYSITKDGDSHIIEVPIRPWLTVVWTITVKKYDLVIKCHTVRRDGLPNEDGLVVRFEDAESVRLKAM